MRFCQSLMYAAPDDWIELTRCAEDVGFDQVSLSDHVFYPDKLESSYPYTDSGRPMFPPDTSWPDVWVMTGALAAVTRRITFSTHVYVLPARNPLVVAKAVGTAAHLSGGRVLLGVGAGWMREEFTQLEQPFERRGARMEEQIEVLRTLWQGGMVEHHGEFYDFDRLEMLPVPPAPVPILVGGHTETALRRAARIGDGWMGVYYGLDELRGYVERLEGYREEYGTAGRPFEVQAAVVDRLPTPDVCAELQAIGVTTLITSAWMMAGLENAPLADNLAALEQFGTDYIAPLRAG
ncbi:MAG TPA: TIGR03619 family F420-dependent LLM class oxidoreductase [Acidimicrobiales bacterium]|nr:TIGR03619 family F420-dependent LLM class oxidoreductase [Acidimicrobiales bacterium]